MWRREKNGIGVAVNLRKWERWRGGRGARTGGTVSDQSAPSSTRNCTFHCVMDLTFPPLILFLKKLKQGDKKKCRNSFNKCQSEAPINPGLNRIVKSSRKFPALLFEKVKETDVEKKCFGDTLINFSPFFSLLFSTLNKLNQRRESKQREEISGLTDMFEFTPTCFPLTKPASLLKNRCWFCESFQRREDV